MLDREMPPFRADHVGSLIRPRALIDARESHKKGEIDNAELLQIQQDCIQWIVTQQQDLGLQSVTDGEYNRTTWQTDFLLRFDNVELVPPRFKVRFHSEKGVAEGSPHTVQVSGKLNRPAGIFVDDYKYLHSIARVTPKITLPSPSVMHFRGGRDAIDRTAYPEIEAFYQDLARVYGEEIADLADAGCRYLQLDEVNFAYLCDPVLREQVQTIGEDPETLPHTYATLINNAISGRPRDMTVTMHLCRGNFAGNWMAEGGYEPVAEILFNEIQVNGYFLEYDSARAGGFEPLRFVPPDKMVVLGLVTTKKPDLESKDELKRRIEAASCFIPLEQLALSPQCGFSSGIGGNTMNTDEQFAKLRLIVEVAEEVWGT
jgi:5-methyltetrahydropteroyltriglutamate--homocysteine methyltransferase